MQMIRHDAIDSAEFALFCDLSQNTNERIDQNFIKESLLSASNA